MAEVYRAYHESLDRYVAIKVLHAFLAEDDEFRVRFEKEARNIAKLNHAHIVQVYDFDYAPDRDSYYMVMELIDGITLKDRLFEMAGDGKKLPLEETLRIVKESASALAYAHRRGMIHRDVKPANLMIDQDNRLVLTDFGIAKMLNSKQLTVSGGMIGTPAYMSPEQGLGEPGDERSDIYSLGVIMYQLLVGALPYDAETALGVILMHVNDPVPDVRVFDPEIPLSIQRIVNRSMAKDSDKRYQTAEEFIADIERFEQGEDIVDADLPSAKTFVDASVARDSVADQPDGVTGATIAPDVSVSPAGKRGFLSWIVGIVVLLGVLGGGYFAALEAGFIQGGVLVDVASPTPEATSIALIDETGMPTEELEETTEVLVVTIEPSATVTATPINTSTSTATSSPLPPTHTPTSIPTETVTVLPTTTPNMTLTVSVAETATIRACRFDYVVVEQIPADGVDGGFIPANQIYTRDITLLNTGTCAWGENTSLTFVSGEDFNAGTRIFVRESVGVGEEVTLRFEGKTPSRGSLQPLVGSWRLRTRGQIDIGDVLNISVLVFEQGS